MKRENNKKFKKRKRNQNRSLTCRVLSMMFAIVLFCSTVLINTDYVSQASSFDDMVDMVEIEEDSAAADTSEDTGDDLGTDVNFESEESTDETYSESDDLGSSDADFSSGENMFTDGTSESNAPAEEAAQPVSCIVKLKNETIEVKAEAPAGVLPNGTQMIVKAVENNTEDAELTDQYNKLAAKITEQLQNQGKNLDGFLAYNVSFTDADGNPVEPSDKVTYSFTYKEASSPELTDPAASTVTAAMIRTNKETSELELTELKAEEDKLTVETNESGQLTKTAFQSAATAAYTFVWSSTPAADDNENNEENGEVNNEEVKADTNTENTEENGEETNTENNVENSEEEQNPEEAPDQEQIKMIRIIADEVNLRVAPSTEAEAIATVDTDTQLPLIETVTGEDEFTWYEVSYEEAEAYVRSDFAEVVENEEQDVKVEEQTPAEITRYDYESDEVNVKVTLTNPEDLPDEAELSVTPVEISQEAEEQINQDAIEQQKAIENIRAYDIKFLLDGEEIQPGETVKVEVSFPEEETAEDADVYHVDENENVENMNGSVNEEGNVEFDTPHFSTYIIVNKSLSGTVKVTLQHYDADTKEPIYAEIDKYINVGGKIPDYRAAENYDIQKVVTVENGKETKVENKNNIEVVKDTTVRIYYKARSSNEKGDMTLYDYQINPGEGKKGINDDSHYSGKDNENRMIMGTQQQAGLNWNAKGTDDHNANTYNERKITKGLITGLSLDDYKEVYWKVDQPGFFTDTNCGEREGKQKYTDYKLNFSKEGNKYKLTGVTRPDNTVANAGADFYPLDSKGVNKVWDKDGKDGNYYFGIRYDIEFQLGDYIGPLNYKFTGDDDLWVLLDGKKVVIDLGGIHQALEGKTDLWEDLGYKNGARPDPNDIDAKNATHRITVLYMERGAGNSNCQMEFTIPDARFVNVTNVPLADITIHKVNSSEAGIPGAKFRLENVNGGETYPLITSDSSGNVKFNNLKVGTYTLTETMAPNGYVSSKETYKVIVTENDGKATATLYHADGTTPVDNNQIVNYTEKEEAEKNLTSSKTAKLVNDNDRTYQIDLNAEVTGREEGEAAKGASVVMVLDVSNSMKEKINNSSSSTTKTTRIKALQEAAKKFISELANASEDSEVSIIWYSGSEDEKSDSELTTIEPANGYLKLSNGGKAALDEYIDNCSRGVSGGTPMGAALQVANEQLKKGQYTNKYVVFMTDGLPGYWDPAKEGYNDPAGKRNNKNCMVANRAVANATKIKENAVLYTVGVGLSSNDTFEWKKGHSSDSFNYDGHEGYIQSDWWSTQTEWNANHEEISGSGFLSSEIATKPKNGKTYAFNTDSLEGLDKIFEDIAKKIGDLYSVQPEKIVDVIDSRFELTQKTITDLAKNSVLGQGETTIDQNGRISSIKWCDSKDNSKIIGQITIEYPNNGSTIITWTGAAAKIGNAEAEDPKDRGWHASLQIKAKDNFIGGNMIPTNGADSGITLEGGSVKHFDQPSVNVKLLDLNISNGETTVFKGESIDPTGYAKVLAETLKIKKLNNDKDTIVIPNRPSFPTLSTPTLSTEQLEELKKNKSITLGTNPDGSHPYEYSYSNTSDVEGYFTYKYRLADNSNGAMEQHEVSTVGTAVEQYELVVTYHPYSIVDRQSKVSGVKVPTAEAGTEVTKAKSVTGVYKVNAIAGQIEITKKLSGEDKAQQDAEFTFEIYKVVTRDGKEVEEKLTTDPQSITAMIKKGDNVAKFGKNESVTIKNLSRGKYVVKETSHDGYKLESAEYNDKTTNCLAVNNTEDVTFTIGTYGNDKNALEAEELKAEKVDYATYAGPGCVGVAKFTNKEITADVNFVKVDATKDLNGNTITISGVEFKLCKAGDNWTEGEEVNSNVIKSGEDGAFKLEKLLPGNYLLVETKAATGYSLPADPWRIIISNTGEVKVTKTNNNEIVPVITGSTKTYQIENARLYSLPSSGGPGIYGFTISGVAFITAALLLFINNKRKEDNIAG